MQTHSTAPLSMIPVSTLKGVGSRLEEKLQKLGVGTVQDLLLHLPYRYQDRTRITPIAYLRRGDYAVIEGTISTVEIKKGKRTSLLIRLIDGTGTIMLRFFNFYSQQRDHLKQGAKLRCFGEVRDWLMQTEMVHPEYRVLDSNIINTVEETLTPIYSTTQGLHQRALRNLIDQALLMLQDSILFDEYLPAFVLEKYNYPHLAEAILFLHRPPPDTSTQILEEGKHPAQQRLAFEELLAQQLALRKLRHQHQAHQAPVLRDSAPLAQKFLKQLPFTLTNAQFRVCDEIATDLIKPYPMLRLIQGDVGSGKTVVAALAMAQAVAAGYKAVLMAPTEILAEQHYQHFTRWYTPLGIDVVSLSGKTKIRERREVLAKCESDSSLLVVGTHALFQKEVNFKKLGLIIVDEQHRFGVEQRMALRNKGLSDNIYPHQLIMTATPIPRSLAMTAYADLDISIIDELPPGRTPVKTVAISNTRRDEIVSRINQICADKRQVYWVCTLIEESEMLQCEAAEKTAEFLRTQLPEVKISLVHGRQKTAEKEAIMAQFKSGGIDVLVATTVIEVGVDVPNASLMVIENAERLGLSQLHQLRGRVGRGAIESHCVLLYQLPLSHFAKERLAVMRETTDGFVIAKKDLEIRGPGEVLGTRQTGVHHFRIADLSRDKELIPHVRDSAEWILHNAPESAERLIKRWIADKTQYIEV